MNSFSQPLFLLAILIAAGWVSIHATIVTLKANSGPTETATETQSGSEVDRSPSRPKQEHVVRVPSPFASRLPSRWEFDPVLVDRAAAWLNQPNAPLPSPARDRVIEWLLRYQLFRHLGSPEPLSIALEIELQTGETIVSDSDSRQERGAIIQVMPWTALTPISVPRSAIVAERELSADQFNARVGRELAKRSGEEITSLVALERAITIALRTADQASADQYFGQWRTQEGLLSLVPTDRVSQRMLIRLKELDRPNGPATLITPLDLANNPFSARSLDDLEERIQQAFRLLGMSRDKPEQIDALVAESDRWSEWLNRFPYRDQDREQRDRLQSRILLFRSDAGKIRGW